MLYHLIIRWNRISNIVENLMLNCTIQSKRLDDTFSWSNTADLGNCINRLIKFGAGKEKPPNV